MLVKRLKIILLVGVLVKLVLNPLKKAIEIVAKNLGGNNPNTERHYADKTTDQILRAYNPPSISATLRRTSDIHNESYRARRTNRKSKT